MVLPPRRAALHDRDGLRLLFDLDPHLVPPVVRNVGRTQSADSGNVGRRKHSLTVERAPAGMDVFWRSVRPPRRSGLVATRAGALRFFAVSEPSQVLVEGQDACVAFVGDCAEKTVV